MASSKRPPEAEADRATSREVGDVVLAAADLPITERALFLRRLSDERPSLLAETRRQLELAAELPESFLAVPAAALLEAADEALPPLAPEARYEILEPAGKGGMGRVYKAFDRRLRRPVALKLLDRMDPAARRRMLREAQAQARVRHEHVLEIYETGEIDGRPYIAMRWVEGPTLLGLRQEISPEEKLRLVAEVAEGLHAAHREGLIHRDVKPSNVLVERTPDGRLWPWIADFGIAVGLDGEGATVDVAGTPGFVAPEVLAGDPARVDRRADVYGLGATLYQLFTGRRLFERKATSGVSTQPGLEEPPDPLHHSPSMPPEVAAIILRCLARDPEQRYPSAQELAQDLRRYLDGEVVEAYAASVAYRWTRFVLRHRKLVAAAALAASLLLAALTTAAVLGVEAYSANQRAQSRRDQAEHLIGFMLDDLRDRLAPLGKLSILDAVDEEALRYFDAVPEQELTERELARRARALYRIGAVRIEQGDFGGAVEPLTRSLAWNQALAGRYREGDPQRGEQLFELGQSHFWVGHVLWEQGKRQAAREHFERYLDLSRELVRIDPARSDWRLELAYGHSNLGTVAQTEGRPAEALERFRATLRVIEALAREEPDDIEWQHELALTHNLLGETSRDLGRDLEALEHFEIDLELRRRLAAARPDHLHWREALGTSHDYLAVLLQHQGRNDEAWEHLTAAHDLFEELVEHDPANALWRYKLGLTTHKLGIHHRQLGRHQEALAAWDRTEDLVRPLAEAEPDHRDAHRLLGETAYQRGLALLETDRLREADRAAALALQILSRFEPAESSPRERAEIAQAHLLRGRLEARMGDPAAADRHWEQALGLLEPAAVDTDTLDARAQALLLLHRDEEARLVAEELFGRRYAQPDFVRLCRDRGLLGRHVPSEYL